MKGWWNNGISLIHFFVRSHWIQISQTRVEIPSPDALRHKPLKSEVADVPLLITDGFSDYTRSWSCTSLRSSSLPLTV